MTTQKNGTRRGKTFEQRFLEVLRRHCNGEDVAISNDTLRGQLGWQDKRFDKVRSELIEKGIVKAAQGRGGKTRLLEFNEIKNPLNVFISYSHHDENIKIRLLQHLKPLERLSLIKIWHDRMIKPGDKFGEIILDELNNAQLIFLLISVDFINSTYCFETELNHAVEMHKNGSVRIVPIILRDCLWHYSPFGELQALPKDAKPVASWSDQDEALTAIAKAVHGLAMKMLEDKY